MIASGVISAMEGMFSSAIIFPSEIRLASAVILASVVNVQLCLLVQ